MLIDRDDAPRRALAAAIQMVQPGHGAGVDREAQGALRLDAEGERKRGANGAAVNHGDDVASGMLGGDPLDRAGDTGDHVLEALAAGRPLARGGVPESLIAAYRFQ